MVIKNTLKMQKLFQHVSVHAGTIIREPPVVCVYTHAQQVGICHHNTDNAHIDKHIGTIPVILARH